MQSTYCSALALLFTAVGLMPRLQADTNLILWRDKCLVSVKAEGNRIYVEERGHCKVIGVDPTGNGDFLATIRSMPIDVVSKKGTRPLDAKTEPIVCVCGSKEWHLDYRERNQAPGDGRRYLEPSRTYYLEIKFPKRPEEVYFTFTYSYVINDKYQFLELQYTPMLEGTEYPYRGPKKGEERRIDVDVVNQTARLYEIDAKDHIVDVRGNETTLRDDRKIGIVIEERNSNR